MDTKTFNQTHELDRQTRRGVRANPKTADALPKDSARTGDGEIFDSSKTYYFFDGETRQIRQSTGLRQIETLYLGSFGLRVVEISKLRTNRNDAIGDDQQFLRNRIAEHETRIAEFESEKT